MVPFFYFGAVTFRFFRNTSHAFRCKSPNPNNSVGVGRLYSSIVAILDHLCVKQYKKANIIFHRTLNHYQQPLVIETEPAEIDIH
jgi:hypothetical protein